MVVLLEKLKHDEIVEITSLFQRADQAHVVISKERYPTLGCLGGWSRAY